MVANSTRPKRLVCCSLYCWPGNTQALPSPRGSASSLRTCACLLSLYTIGHLCLTCWRVFLFFSYNYLSHTKLQTHKCKHKYTQIQALYISLSFSFSLSFFLAFLLSFFLSFLTCILYAVKTQRFNKTCMKSRCACLVPTQHHSHSQTSTT